MYICNHVLFGTLEDTCYKYAYMNLQNKFIGNSYMFSAHLKTFTDQLTRFLIT